MQRPGSDADAAPDADTVQLIEEVARIQKHEAVTGRIRVSSITESFEEVVRDTLATEKVQVERVAFNRIVSEVPATRVEDGVTIIPIVEEVLFVEKRLVLKEELHIRRVTDHESVEIPITLKKQRAVIDRDDAVGGDPEE